MEKLRLNLYQPFPICHAGNVGFMFAPRKDDKGIAVFSAGVEGLIDFIVIPGEQKLP